MIARLFERFSDLASVEISDRGALVSVPAAGKPGRVAPAVAVAILLAERRDWVIVRDYQIPDPPQVVIE